jgi:antitoxin CptB
VDKANLNQLRWRCRRGMRELDLLLCGHLDRHGATLSGAPLELFERLLACNDVDLYAWFTGREHADDTQLAQLVAVIVKEAPPGRGGAPRP